MLSELINRLQNADMSVLGYLYMPFKGYVKENMLIYAMITLAGAVLIGLAYLLYVKNIIKLREQNKKGFRLFISTFVFFAVITSYVTLIYPPTGDEPHHLLIMKSIMNDRDLNLENDLVTERSYLEFYPVEMPYLDTHNNAGKDGKGLYSKHGQGLPVLLIPFYAAGKRYGAQLFMNLLSAVLILLLYKCAVYRGISESSAVMSAAIFAFATPVTLNASLILTEVPAAIAIAYALMLFLRGTVISLKEKLLLFAMIAFMPWLHIKFAVISAGLFIAYYIYALKNKHVLLREEAIINLLPAVSAIIFILLNMKIYGRAFGATAAAISPTYYFVFDIKYSIKAFFAMLFDRNFGLLLYFPVFIISIWGIINSAMQKKKIWPLLIVAPYFILFLSWNDWSGSMFPGRQLIPVFPVLFLYFSDILQKKFFLPASRVIISISTLFTFIMMAIPAIRFTSAKEKIFAAASAKIWFLKDILPSFHDAISLKHFIFCALFSAFMIIMFIRKNRPV